jgi:hypothetical protein
MGVHNNIFKQITKILEQANIEEILERTRIDEFPKKLTLFLARFVWISFELTDSFSVALQTNPYAKATTTAAIINYLFLLCASAYATLTLCNMSPVGV